MPTRSLHSRVFIWPDREQVLAAARAWAARTAAASDAVAAVILIGSYAPGDWAVGSDADLIVLVSACDRPRHERAHLYPADDLPVPADVTVYTVPEWRRLAEQNARIVRCARDEGLWLHGGPDTIRITSGPSAPRRR